MLASLQPEHGAQSCGLCYWNRLKSLLRNYLGYLFVGCFYCATTTSSSLFYKSTRLLVMNFGSVRTPTWSHDELSSYQRASTWGPVPILWSNLFDTHWIAWSWHSMIWCCSILESGHCSQLSLYFVLKALTLCYLLVSVHLTLVSKHSWSATYHQDDRTLSLMRLIRSTCYSCMQEFLALS